MILHPNAEAEIREILRWHEDHREGLGALFSAAARRVFERVEAVPLSFPEHPDDARARRALVRGWPYVVAFVIAPNDEPHVVAVYHVRREPGYWRGRL